MLIVFLAANCRNTVFITKDFQVVLLRELHGLSHMIIILKNSQILSQFILIGRSFTAPQVVLQPLVATVWRTVKMRDPRKIAGKVIFSPQAKKLMFIRLRGQVISRDSNKVKRTRHISKAELRSVSKGGETGSFLTGVWMAATTTMK